MFETDQRLQMQQSLIKTLQNFDHIKTGGRAASLGGIAQHGDAKTGHSKKEKLQIWGKNNSACCKKQQHHNVKTLLGA